MTTGQPSPAADDHLPAPVTLAVTGDAFITRGLPSDGDSAHLRMLEIIRQATAAFTNLEVVLHDYEHPPSWPSGGTHARGAPRLAHDLARAGFSMVSRANNHAGDFGVGGMRSTTAHVEAAGLVHAGVGEDLDEAREARFVETDGARFALVSAATTFPEHAAAAPAGHGVRGRPGLSPLRIETEITLGAPAYEELAFVADAAGFTRPHRGLGLQPPVVGDGFRLAGAVVRSGDGPAVVQRLRASDVEALRAVVRDAAQLSDVVVVSLHTHDSGETLSDPPSWLRSLCRQLADDGAHAIACHGPHRLRGIETFDSCVAFYSLGNFIFQNETVQRLPSESYQVFGLPGDARVGDFLDARYDGGTSGFPASRAYWESVIAVPQWQRGALIDVALHPVTLGFGAPRTRRGRPVLAEADDAVRILADLEAMSKPFSTRLVRDGAIGHVVV